MRCSPFNIGCAIGLVLNLSLSTFITHGVAQARPAPPCTFQPPILPIDQSPCVRSPGECLDTFVQGVQFVWESIFPPSTPFVFPDSFVHTMDMEINAPGEYAIAATATSSYFLRVYDIDELRPDDPDDAQFICGDQVATYIQYNVRCHLILGETITIHGGSGIVALAVSYEDAANQTIHRVIWLAPLRQDVVEYLRNFAASREKWMNGEGGCFPYPEPCDRAAPPPDPSPCLDDISCDRQWRQDTQDTSRKLTDCMKGQVKPLGLLTILCFVSCAAAALGTSAGVLAPACVAICLGGAGITGMIDFDTCYTIADHEKEQNLIKYCACIEWKRVNCQPEQQEPEVRTCN